jgi:hypothetical protein
LELEDVDRLNRIAERTISDVLDIYVWLFDAVKAGARVLIEESREGASLPVQTKACPLDTDFKGRAEK